LMRIAMVGHCGTSVVFPKRGVQRTCSAFSAQPLLQLGVGAATA
jgi:hypothetical protein